MFELEWQDEGGKMLCVKGEVPKANSYNAFYDCGLNISELLITWAEKQKGYSYAMDMHGSEYDEVDWPKIVVERHLCQTQCSSLPWGYGGGVTAGVQEIALSFHL